MVRKAETEVEKIARYNRIGKELAKSLNKLLVETELGDMLRAIGYTHVYHVKKKAPQKTKKDA